MTVRITQRTRPLGFACEHVISPAIEHATDPAVVRAALGNLDKRFERVALSDIREAFIGASNSRPAGRPWRGAGHILSSILPVSMRALPHEISACWRSFLAAEARAA